MEHRTDVSDNHQIKLVSCSYHDTNKLQLDRLSSLPSRQETLFCNRILEVVEAKGISSIMPSTAGQNLARWPPVD